MVTREIAKLIRNKLKYHGKGRVVTARSSTPPTTRKTPPKLWRFISIVSITLAIFTTGQLFYCFDQLPIITAEDGHRIGSEMAKCVRLQVEWWRGKALLAYLNVVQT